VKSRETYKQTWRLSREVKIHGNESLVRKHTRSLTLLFIKILFILITSFIFFEIILTLFNDFFFSKSAYLNDPEIGFRLRPYSKWGVVTTNEFGFNDRDYPQAKKLDEKRIVVLGDSFNWACGYENNYTNVLRKKLKSRIVDNPIEVINTGYPGTHTGEELEILRKYGMQYHPDMVILSFFTGNDFYDAQPWRKRIVLGSALTDIDLRNPFYFTILGNPVVFKSRLLMFLKKQQLSHKAILLSAQESSNDCQFKEEFLENVYNRILIIDSDHQAQFRPNFDFITSKIIEMKNLLDRENVEFLIAAIPDEIQVNKKLRYTVIEKFKLDESKYNWNLQQEVLQQICIDNQISYYDLLPDFLSVSDNDTHLYNCNDVHWSEKGNEFAGNLLYNRLLSLMNMVN
jgi:hypothetical protein